MRFLLDDLDGFVGRVRPRCGVADHQGCLVEPDEAVGNPVRQPPLLADFAVEARREGAATEDMIDNVRRHEIRIAAAHTGAAETDCCLGNIELDHDPAAHALRSYPAYGVELGEARKAADMVSERHAGGFRL